MSRAVKIYSGADIKGPASLNTTQVLVFPDNPLLGTFVTKDDVVWVYQNDNGVNSWQPYHGKSRAYEHIQAIAASTWSFDHNLGTTNVWFQVRDSLGDVVACNLTAVNENSSTISFTEPVAGSAILISPISYGIVAEDTGSLPQLKPLLVYYGYPIAYKGMWDVASVVAEISANYKVWVVGNTYQDPTHEEYATTNAIIDGVRANGVTVYGYVPLGVTSFNYTQAQMRTIVDQWIAIGIDGIFLDEFGFDYGSDRQRQKDIVTYVHQQSLPICANAWVVEEFACDNISELAYPADDWRYVRFLAKNPTNLALPRLPGDSFLIENFCYSHNGVEDMWSAQDRVKQVQQLSTAKNFELWAVAVFAETTPGNIDYTKMGKLGSIGYYEDPGSLGDVEVFPNRQALLQKAGIYISANAYMYDIAVVGSGGYSFGSGGTPLWAPLKRIPKEARQPLALATHNNTNKTFVRYFGDLSITIVNDSAATGVSVDIKSGKHDALTSVSK